MQLFERRRGMISDFVVVVVIVVVVVVVEMGPI